GGSPLGPSRTHRKARARACARTQSAPMADFVEIDHRANGGIDVSLLWDRDSDLLYVQVIDWGMDEDSTFCVEPERALDAFRHPCAYADRCGGMDESAQPVVVPLPELQSGSR